MTWSPDYASASDLKAYLRIDDALDDTQVSLAIAAASRAVDAHCNRQFGQVDVPEARTYTAHRDRDRCRWVVDIDDLMTNAGLVASTTAGALTVTPGPAVAAAYNRPWTRLVVDTASTVRPNSDEDGVTVTAQWGWSGVPVAVEQATLLQASRLFTRRNAPFGVAGSPELGSELRLLAKVDPDVAVLLAGYRRRRAVG